MILRKENIVNLYNRLDPKVKDRIDTAKSYIVKAKEKGQKIVAVVGSGPNIHEGVSTLIAELMNKKIIQGVCTSSATVCHEMGGTLEEVKRAEGGRIKGLSIGLPSFGQIEATVLSTAEIEAYKKQSFFDFDLYDEIIKSPGETVIKAAGNMAYPGGLAIELLSEELLKICRLYDLPFEKIVGEGCDPRTMVGAGALLNIPVIVTVPQLVGGGKVGLAIGDSIPISQRSLKVAEILDSADVIIESAIALCQEIHDGPFETYTGHGIWADWSKEWTFSLENKKIVRIDLDPNIECAWQLERGKNRITSAVIGGLPKAKSTGLPFRMEMSGFSRIPGSLPIIGDIGSIWPVLATLVAEDLGVDLDFMSYNQSSEEGIKMRKWIVENIKPVNRTKISEKYPY